MRHPHADVWIRLGPYFSLHMGLLHLFGRSNELPQLAIILQASVHATLLLLWPLAG